MIQCLARFQETFKRFKACLTQSSLTWREVMPSANLTSAASSSVHTLVSLSKSLGLRCNRTFNFSRPSSLNIGRLVFGRREPISKTAAPRSLKATMALRTVCSSQPRNSAMRGALSPRALDRMIWLRLTVNGSDARKPSLSFWRSALLNSRTKIGFLNPFAGGIKSILPHHYRNLCPAVNEMLTWICSPLNVHSFRLEK